MKTRLILFMVIACGIANSAFPQQTVYYQSLSDDMLQARELYKKNDFIAAGELFSRIAEQSEAGTAIHSEALFFEALSVLRGKPEHGEEFVQQYLAENPESAYRNKAWFELASVRFNTENYVGMLLAYEKVDPTGLSREDLTKMTYQKGYALFRGERYTAAEEEFEKIKDSAGKMAAPAKYYWAHIKYLNDDYDEALEAFMQLRSNAAFGSVIPYYISHIYYKQGRYAEVVEMTEPLLKTAGDQQRPGLSKILANSYFQLDQFQNAIPHFEAYFNETQSLQRDENYMLGYCYYVTGAYRQSVVPLEHASKGDDLLAQNAYYHLADSYIRTGDKNKARIAFEAASEMDFNAEIKEDALFNFAKITYELSYSPFNETIKAFDKYISHYPDSERNAAAYAYLVKVYMSTNNFKDAAASIERIRVKTPAIKKAWQRVSYFHGLELFKNLNYPAAVEQFSKSLENGEFDPKIRAEATYWRAESWYQLEKHRPAINDFNQFLTTPGASSLPEFKTVHYSLGYACFKIKDYDNAISSFRKFIAINQNQIYDKVGDAWNRIADCYFIKRDYMNAVKSYDQAYLLNVYDPDYALYQKAICLGLQQEPEQKISSLRSLLQTFAESDLADDASYELGRTYERINQPKVAVGYYTDVLNDYPQSSYRTKAMLQLGLIHYNQSDFDQSLTWYKKIVEQYPNSAEAKSALLGIKNNYVEMNDVEAYFTYTRQIGTGAQISASEQDSLSYQTAEKLVMKGDPKAGEQLERYLEQFPSGSFSLNARFYLAENNYAAGNYTKALADYESVLSRKDHLFTEQALARAAELQYNAAEYAKALSHYERLEKTANSKWNLIAAKAGKMRCHFKLENFQAAVESAETLLGSENVPGELKREATYRKAKSLLLGHNEAEAFPLFRELAQDVKSAEGAESKYLVAEILASQNKADEAEKEVMDFISKNTPHQFWLAKSFILLADIYLGKNDGFQAKHTLKSIIENYTVTNDGIIETARIKLSRLEEQEQEQQQKKENPIQIDINQQ
ncbi:MAG: tetratricopeptide repeat protein [Prolixibacteraceae bacterium]